MSHHTTEVAPGEMQSCTIHGAKSVLSMSHECQECSVCEPLKLMLCQDGAPRRPPRCPWGPPSPRPVGLAFFSSFLVTGCTFFFFQAFFAAATPCNHCINNVKAVRTVPNHYAVQVLPGNLPIRGYLRFWAPINASTFSGTDPLLQCGRWEKI